VVRRSAFTLIELVFAIVVIAIAVLSLPMMNDVTSKGIENNIVQEAIFAASTELNQDVTYFWDENTTVEDEYGRVIWMDSSDCNDTTKLRPGQILQKLHRRCNDDSSIRPTFTSDGDEDDLDDANKSNQHLLVGDATTASGYKKDYLIDVNITNNASFGDTTDANVIRNIKRVLVTVKDADGNVITKIETFASNVGGIRVSKRSF